MFYCAYFKIFRRKSKMSTTGGPCILFLNRRSLYQYQYQLFVSKVDIMTAFSIQPVRKENGFKFSTRMKNLWNEEFVEIPNVNGVESVKLNLKNGSCDVSFSLSFKHLEVG